MFRDARLDELEALVDVDNQSLRAAVAQLAQARAQVGVARADYYPTLTTGPGVGVTQTRVSQNRALFIPGAKINYTDIIIPADVSYEVDVWGRVRRSVEAARADAQASEADLAAVRLTLQAELATDYLSLRSLDAEAQLLDSSVQAFEQALVLTQNRHRGGVTSALDVAQAETQLEVTRAQAIDVRVSRAQTEHAIAVLIGRPPSSFALAAVTAPLEPPVIPATGLPSDLLERRPDVAAAERRMASANARIGVAKAAYFPAISLNASGGVQSALLSNLFSVPSLFFAVGASALAHDLRRRAAAGAHRPGARGLRRGRGQLPRDGADARCRRSRTRWRRCASWSRRRRPRRRRWRPRTARSRCRPTATRAASSPTWRSSSPRAPR